MLGRAAGRPPAWLGLLDVGNGTHVEIPAPDGDAVIVAGHAHPARSRSVRGSDCELKEAGTTDVHLPVLPERIVRQALRVRPSVASGPNRAAARQIAFGGRITLIGTKWPWLDRTGSR